MELASAFQIHPDAGEKPGAFVTFPYDRDLVRHFREEFPRARWREAEGRWFVPGKTAVQRLDIWIAAQLADLDRHADEKGRDAFIFDPLESDYLVVGDDLAVRTPYSRTVVEELRAIPFARWDPEARLWRVPFRSYEELRRRWPVIEEAARRNEPEAKRQRRAERRPPGEAALFLLAERRRKRYPVLLDRPPPLDEPVAIFHFGVVVFEAIDVEPMEDIAPMEALRIYPHVHDQPGCYAWAHWRMPILQEVYFTRPLKRPVSWEWKVSAGWWPFDQDERKERLRKLREIERAQRTRHEKRKLPAESAEPT